MQPTDTQRVSRAMKRLGLVVALALLAGSIWFLQRPRHRDATAGDDPPPPRSTERTAPATALPKTITKVTKIPDAETRQQLADRIASAQSARAATRAAPIPRLPATDGGTTLDESPIGKTEIRAAMRELVPHLAKCYEDALPTLPSPDFKMTAELTLTGDPDIGTLVDAKALADHAGKPLPAPLDDCFRSTFQLMALPPLAEGDQIEVRYPFEFRAH